MSVASASILKPTTDQSNQETGDMAFTEPRESRNSSVIQGKRRTFSKDGKWMGSDQIPCDTAIPLLVTDIRTYWEMWEENDGLKRARYVPRNFAVDRDTDRESLGDLDRTELKFGKESDVWALGK